MLLTLDIHNSYVHHLERVLYQKWQKNNNNKKHKRTKNKKPFLENAMFIPCSLGNVGDCMTTFQKVYTGYVCSGGDSDGVRDGRKGVLPDINTTEAFCSWLLDTESKTDESPLLLLLHTNVLHPFPHYHSTKDPFKTFSF